MFHDVAKMLREHKEQICQAGPHISSILTELKISIAVAIEAGTTKQLSHESLAIDKEIINLADTSHSLEDEGKYNHLCRYQVIA